MESSTKKLPFINEQQAHFQKLACLTDPPLEDYEEWELSGGKEAKMAAEAALTKRLLRKASQVPGGRLLSWQFPSRYEENAKLGKVWKKIKVYA